VAATIVRTNITAIETQVELAGLAHQEYFESRWYAVSTSARHEKCVAWQMTGLGVEHFLPVYKSLRRWKDRRKELELPLFPGYLFVHIALKDRLRVLRIPGVAHLVGTHGKPVHLRDIEIERLQAGLLQGNRVAPHPYLRIGRRVRVANGPMTGIEGLLVRRKDGFRVVLSVDLIQRSFALEVDESDIVPA
jgi:transcription antitermination factor NusG